MYRVFHNFWNKATAAQIFPVDFILLLFLDYSREIFSILIYSTQYRKIIPQMIKQKIFSGEDI